MSDKDDNHSESGITNVRLGEGKGLLSPLGDPLGNGLQKGLGPVGNTLGGLTQSISGQSTDLLRGASQALGVTKSDEQQKREEEAEKLGGKEQTANNPLGL